MTLLEALAPKVGPSIAKAILKYWLQGVSDGMVGVTNRLC